MPILYYAPGARSLSVHIVLEWIGKPYDLVRIDYHDPEYKRINPAGAVPALDHGGEQPLTQCAAVLQYLARVHPEADLLDETSAESAAELERWSAFLTGDLHPAFFPAFLPGRYTASKDPAALGDVKAAGLALVKTKLGFLDQHLSGRTWMTGGKRTILDAYVTPMLNWAASMLPDGLQTFPSAATHHCRMLADPAVHRAMLAEGWQRNGIKGQATMDNPIELGLDTFGDVTAGADGTLLPHAQVIRDVIEEGVLADQTGVDFFGVGEHHRADYAISSPEIVLAAIAARTARMRLGTAVTVLSSDDPVRLYQRFSTLNAVSNGRAEVILGRGSFTESFPLFGYALETYKTLFEEKLDLFAALRQGGPVTWQGTARAPLRDQEVFPPVEGTPLRV